MVTTTTTPATPAPTPAPTAPVTSEIKTFEDAVTAIDAALTADPETKNKTLQGVKNLLQKRMAKRASDLERDGISAVRTAIKSRPKFNVFGQKPVTDTDPGTV